MASLFECLTVWLVESCDNEAMKPYNYEMFYFNIHLIGFEFGLCTTESRRVGIG